MIVYSMNSNFGSSGYESITFQGKEVARTQLMTTTCYREGSIQDIREENRKLKDKLNTCCEMSHRKPLERVLDIESVLHQSHTERSLWLKSTMGDVREGAVLSCAQSHLVSQDMLMEISNKHHVQLDLTGPKTTLGLVVTGCKIVSIVPGTSAALPLKDASSGKWVHVEVGDSLIEVDGVQVTADNAPEVLRGSDEVGSYASIVVEKGVHSPSDALDRWSGSSNKMGSRDSWKQEKTPREVIEVRMVRASIARVKPLSEMVLALAKAAEAKHVSAADIHDIKKKADAYFATEANIFDKCQAHVQHLEALALAESDICHILQEALKAAQDQVADKDEQIAVLKREVQNAKVDLKRAREYTGIAAELIAVRNKLEGVQEANVKLVKEQKQMAAELCELKTKFDAAQEANEKLVNDRMRLIQEKKSLAMKLDNEDKARMTLEKVCTLFVWHV